MKILEFRKIPIRSEKFRFIPKKDEKIKCGFSNFAAIIFPNKIKF